MCQKFGLFHYLDEIALMLKYSRSHEYGD